MQATYITGTGVSIPPRVVLNEDFYSEKFFEENGQPLTASPQIIVEKFRKITGIRERRYAADNQFASDLAAEAGKQAILDSGVDPETLDQIIVAHNFGDVAHGSLQSQNVPSLACRVKHLLGIQNPACIAFDVLVGCPGWVHAVLQTHAFFKAGMAKKALIIGAETLSRVIDPSDRDSMIFSDGAGACVLEYKEREGVQGGILSVGAQTHSVQEVDYINMGKSYKQEPADPAYYVKMKGRRVYEYALKNVPLAMKACLDASGVDIKDLKKIMIHQANEKMDEEIVKRFYELYGMPEVPAGIMPMIIQWLGNSSVATIPTLYHLIRTRQLEDHALETGDVVLFASVGAGMNINAVCYRV